MRTLKVMLNAKDQRSDTCSLLNGENQLLIRPFTTDIKDLVLVLQDSDGMKRRVSFVDIARYPVNENVKRFSSFWFESAPGKQDCEIAVELK
ncbi:MAG: hypothetical protein ACXVPQ_11510 [Bacteroidia bacterium]